MNKNNKLGDFIYEQVSADWPNEIGADICLSCESTSFHNKNIKEVEEYYIKIM